MELKFKPVLARIALPSTILFLIFFVIFSLLYVLTFLISEYYLKLGAIGAVTLLMLILITSFITTLGSVKNTTYIITDKFITRRKFFISEVQEDVPLSQITNVDYRIGFMLDKLFSTGSIQIYTSGTNFSEITITGVRDVVKIYEQINDLLKLNKSEELDSSGEFSKTVKADHKSHLLERVKPDVFFPTLFSVFSAFFSLFFFGIYLFAGLMTLLRNHLVIGILLIALICIIWVSVVPILTYKAYKKKYYDFYTDKLEYYDGFLNLHKSTVPLERITNISENKSLVEMIIGLSRIEIETAGSSGAEIKIGYVKDGDKIVARLKEVLKKHGRN